jgi:hypothetical protein
MARHIEEAIESPLAFGTDPDGTPTIILDDTIAGASFSADPDGTPVLVIGA